MQGNLIGTDARGAVALSIRRDGVLIGRFVVRSGGGPNNLIGGVDPGAGNVISGNNGQLADPNEGNGVRISGDRAAGNRVLGNFIGTDVTGRNPLPNVAAGVRIENGARGNVIGVRGSKNTIAFNGKGMVVDASGQQNSFDPNGIFSNAGLGIDLGDDGVTPNDRGDADIGANNLQNFPVLTSATSGGGTTTIRGRLNSASSTSFSLEFFANRECDPSGFGEGETFIGATIVTTNNRGNARFTVSFPTAVPTGQFVTATATDPNGNTSEFSQCRRVRSRGP